MVIKDEGSRLVLHRKADVRVAVIGGIPIWEILINVRLFRIGGDEFVVFPAGASRERVEASMAQVTAALAEQGFSISYGLAVGHAVMGLNDLVREADERMLEQKRAYYSEHDRREAR